MEKETVIVPENLNGERIDKAMAELCKDISRSRIVKLIDDGKVSLDDIIVKAARQKVQKNQIISYEIPENVEVNIEAENIPLDILYEDNDVVIVNKPKGMVVHPAAGHYSGTLVNALMYHCGNSLSGINGELRPGIVHRIDRDTTGILVVCKNDKAHISLSEQLSEHSINRIYYCIVYGGFKTKEGTIDAPIARHPRDRKKMAIDRQNGRRAVTHYECLYTFKNGFSLLKCRLETGRTHQIRVHMSSVSHPLLGDVVYGKDKQPYDTEGQVLHAAVLGFIHPSTNEYVEFVSPLPDYFIDLCRKFCNDQSEFDSLSDILKACSLMKEV